MFFVKRSLTIAKFLRTYCRLSLSSAEQHSRSSGHTSLFINFRSESGWIWQSLAEKTRLHSTLGSVPEAARLLRFLARDYHCHAQNTSQVRVHLPSLFSDLRMKEVFAWPSQKKNSALLNN
jgi:hypothetical protein